MRPPYAYQKYVYVYQRGTWVCICISKEAHMYIKRGTWVCICISKDICASFGHVPLLIYIYIPMCWTYAPLLTHTTEERVYMYMHMYVYMYIRVETHLLEKFFQQDMCCSWLIQRSLKWWGRDCFLSEQLNLEIQRCRFPMDTRCILKYGPHYRILYQLRRNTQEDRGRGDNLPNRNFRIPISFDRHQFQ